MSPKRTLWIALFCTLLPFTSGAFTSTALADKMYSAVGNALFKRIWSTRPSSVANSDGLGPLFNTRSCHACHPAGNGSGGVNVAPGEKLHQGFAIKMIPTDPNYGNQIQPNGAIGILGEGTLSTGSGKAKTPGKYANGSQTFQATKDLTITVANMNYGPITSPISLRMAPRLYVKAVRGQIPIKQLKAWADPEDKDKDGVSGRIRWLGPKTQPIPGRYGWRGDAASLVDQVAGAFSTDMGLSSRLHPEPAGDCTPAQRDCVAAAGKPQEQHEVTNTVLNYTTRFSGEIGKKDYRKRYSAEKVASKEFVQGMELFSKAACDTCHQPTFVSIQGKTEYLFSDGLLHDMGQELADPDSAHIEARREWLTPPLTGLGYFARKSKKPLSYLHDGRTQSLEEAILAHGGEGERSRAKYEALPKAAKDRLIAFVREL